MRAMKDSGVDWLGEIPSDWSLRPLWSVYRRVKRTGFSDELLLSVYRDHGVIPKASRDDNHNVESLDLSTYQLVEPSDLAVNKMKAWQGSLSVSGFRGIVSPAYFVFKLQTQGVHTGYLHHLLRSNPYVLSYLLSSKGVRIGQWDLQPEIFRRTPVLLPPLREQEAISRHIDQETSQIDLLISKKEQLIEKLLERRQALITHVVTKGLDPNAPMKESRVEWIGAVPEHWEFGSLGRFSTFQTGATPSQESSSAVGEVGWMRPDDLDETGNPSTGSRFYSNESLLKLPSARSGSSLVCGIGSIGKVGFVDQLTYFNQQITSVSSSKIFDRFLYFLLVGARTELENLAVGNVVQILNNRRLASLVVPLPSDVEQVSIAGHLDQETSQIDTLLTRTRKAIELLKERRQALITQVATGKIDVRGFAGGNS